MKWILIAYVIQSASGSVALTSAEFDDQQSCIVAGRNLAANVGATAQIRWGCQASKAAK